MLLAQNLCSGNTAPTMIGSGGYSDLVAEIPSVSWIKLMAAGPPNPESTVAAHFQDAQVMHGFRVQDWHEVT